jgi:ABC-type polysaccharide/polyol phosphate export permease
MVFGNLSVAVLISAGQVGALIVASLLRGSHFTVGPAGVLWFVAATIGVAVAMHSVAEILAARIPKQEEYVGVAPAVALLPWFFAGSFFRINAMPAGLTAFAKVLPLTHAVALMRYALVDRRATGLHDIWGMGNVGAMAALSLLVVTAFAAVMFFIATRVFERSAVQ